MRANIFINTNELNQWVNLPSRILWGILAPSFLDGGGYRFARLHLSQYFYQSGCGGRRVRRASPDPYFGSKTYTCYLPVTTNNSYVQWNVMQMLARMYVCTLRAQDSSRLRIQSLQYRSQGPLGKDYFRTTIFFPANFVTLLAVIWLDGEHYFSAGMYTPNNIKL